MQPTQIDQLLGMLRQNPGNQLLRMAIVRRLIDADELSKALSIVIDVDPSVIADQKDRDTVAQLLNKSGLADLAALWSAAATVLPVRTEAVSSQTIDTVVPKPGEKPALRIVTGKEANEDNVVVLPEPAQAPLKFKDVGGLADVKRDIERRIIAPFTQKSLYAKFRKRVGGGVMLYGPPGCGKTLLARATAGECGLPFQSISIPEILDPYIGVSEQRMSKIFETARRRAPSVLFFDEIDALAAKRTSASTTHQAQLVSNFLIELDGGDEKNSGLLVLAATNVPWSLDPAFLRPGRFDRMFFVPPPDREARAAILDLELGKRPRANDINLDALARKLSGFSGADIAGVVERAADSAIDATIAAGREVPIDQKMALAACESMQSTVVDWLTTARNYATYANESGRYNEILTFLQKHARG